MEAKTANTEYSDPIISSLITSESLNQKCFDCRKKKISWASINNSIYLCSTCANMHKKLGKDVSDVRSLYIDNWSEEQIKYLQCGGNNRLSELLSLYQLDPKSLNTVLFYNSNLLNFHREIIKSEVENTKCPIMPKPDDAFELSEKADLNLITDLLKKKNWCSLVDIMSEVYSGIKHKAGGAVTSIKDGTCNVFVGIKEGTNYALSRTFKFLSFNKKA